MGTGERSDSGGRSDWPVILCGAVGAGAFGAVGLFVIKPLVELPLWLGPIAFAVMIGVGSILGQLVGGWLFQPSPASPPDHPPRA